VGVFVEELDADAAGIGPVFRVGFVGLEGRGEHVRGEDGGQGLQDGVGQWVLCGQLGRDTATSGTGAGGGEVDGVD